MTIIGDIFKPLFYLIAGLIAFFYGLVHNYAVAIALLTITVMAFLWPLTALSTRRMIAMQKIQPELKEIQTKYKSDRVRQSEEMNRLFKENKVSPVSGCLPMLLQFPVLFVMYDVIRGLTNRTAAGIAAPKYVGHSTSIYKDLIKSNGAMHALGIDLGTAATHVKGFANALPYYVVVLLAIGLVFLSTYQIYSKNPQAASANPQQAAIMKYTPLIYGVIYIGIPAGVNLYFVVSSLFRIAQQEFMWRRDPLLRSHSEESRQKAKEIKELKASGKYVEPPKKGFMDKVREASAEQQRNSKPAPNKGSQAGRKPTSSGSNNKKKKK
ncbi:MAG: YidC/Oxa1 family membrane protein insertase [Actinomycetota bacterium]|nr:YidC/Oxa1 family membrane protein insertase [Actinomycetota bacterium]